MGNERTVKYSTSMVKCFKQCRKKYFLEYVKNLKPIQTPAALQLGTLYHKGIELLLNGMELPNIKLELEAAQRNACLDANADYDPILNGIAFEMVKVFYRESGYASWGIDHVEKAFEVPTAYGKRLIGKIDVIANIHGNKFVVDHKTTSRWGEDGGEYLHSLLWDEQSTNYLYAYEQIYGEYAKGMLYVIIEKPTFKLSKATPLEKRKYTKTGALYASQREEDETPEEYLARVAEWYREKPRLHIHLQHRTPAELEKQVHDLNLVFKDMADCEKSETYYRNPAACSILDCPYRSKCLEDTADTDCLFVEKKARSEELL